MRKACSKQRESVLRAAEEVADLQHDKVPGREHLVEIVRVDLEQDRGHSSGMVKPSRKHAWCEHLFATKHVFLVGAIHPSGGREKHQASRRVRGSNDLSHRFADAAKKDPGG